MSEEKIKQMSKEEIKQWWRDFFDNLDLEEALFDLFYDDFYPRFMLLEPKYLVKINK